MNYLLFCIDTIGISINSQLMYIPDIDSWDEWIFAESAFTNHKFSLVDATFYDLSKEGISISRDLKTIPHPCVVETVSKFAHLISSNCKIVLTHLNHSNPICNSSSDEYKETVAKGFQVAQEGQIFNLD